MRFRVKNVKHVQVDPATGKDRKYTKGDIVESDINLCETFQNAFERLADKPPKAAAAMEVDEEEPAIEEEPVEEEQPSPFGKDVTDGFKDAKFKIYHDKEIGFSVVDPENPNEALNGKRLNSKAAVVAFMKGL